MVVRVAIIMVVMIMRLVLVVVMVVFFMVTNFGLDLIQNGRDTLSNSYSISVFSRAPYCPEVACVLNKVRHFQNFPNQRDMEQLRGPAGVQQLQQLDPP